jgi:hypothetical protein
MIRAICHGWRFVTIGPGVLAWLALIAAAVLTLTAGATILARIVSIACVCTGLLTFSIGAAIGSGCGPEDYYAYSKMRPTRAETRMKLHLGMTMGALPAIGGAALLALSLLRRKPRA